MVAAIRQHGGIGAHSLLATARQAGVDKLDECLSKAKLQSVAAIATILNPRIKLHKLRELGWSSAELSRDRQAFMGAFDAYLTRFSQAEDEVDEKMMTHMMNLIFMESLTLLFYYNKLAWN